MINIHVNNRQNAVQSASELGIELDEEKWGVEVERARRERPTNGTQVLHVPNAGVERLIDSLIEGGSFLTEDFARRQPKRSPDGQILAGEYKRIFRSCFDCDEDAESFSLATDKDGVEVIAPATLLPALRAFHNAHAAWNQAYVWDNGDTHTVELVGGPVRNLAPGKIRHLALSEGGIWSASMDDPPKRRERESPIPEA